MAELTPVPGQRSPFDGWRGWVVGVVVIGILVAVAKPWGSDADQTAVASPSAPLASARVANEPTPLPTAVGRVFDPFLLGATPPAAAWAILTPRGLTALDFLTADPVATPSAGPAADPGAAASPDVVAGPVVELGTTDDPGALAIAHPREVELGTIRLWRFSPDGSPTRVDLDPVATAWEAPHVSVLGHRRSDMEPDIVLGWDPGLYRLDLLIEPGDAVRSVMLVVRPGRDGGRAEVPGAAGGDEPPRGSTAFERGALRLLPRTANLWAVGGYLSGWYRDTAQAGCAVAEIWQADARDGCWPVPLGPTDAVGVNLIGDAVTSIGLRVVDPLPGPAGSTSQLDVDGQAGLAFVRAPAGGLADGIYRLDVGTADGMRLTWYLEVGPIGRAVARFYERAASR